MRSLEETIQQVVPATLFVRANEAWDGIVSKEELMTVDVIGNMNHLSVSSIVERIIKQLSDPELPPVRVSIHHNVGTQTLHVAVPWDWKIQYDKLYIKRNLL